MELWNFRQALGDDVAELRGMSVEGIDGKIGTVKEVVNEVGSGGLIVDMGPWIFGKTVMLPAGVVTAIDTDQESVFIDRARDEVKNAPDHDPEAADDAAQRAALTAYYGAEDDEEPASRVAPASGASAFSSAATEAQTPVAPFGRPAGDQTDTPPRFSDGAGKAETPPTSTFGGADQADTAPAPVLDDSGDADDGRGRQSTAPIEPAFDQPETPSGESVGLETGDAPTTPGTESGARETQPFGVHGSERPATSSEQHEAREAEITPPSSSVPSESVASAPLSETDHAETSEDATAAAGVHSGLASTTDDLAPERSGAAREETEHTPKAPAEARSERNTGSGAGKSAPKSRSSTSDSTPRSGGKSGGSGASRKSADDVPIARYDSLTAAEVVAHLRKLSQRELAKVERYEKRHDSRQTILSRIDSLREDEPWRGYDDATVDEVRKKLTNADDDRARAARDYERRHRERKGVMEAARRTLRST